MARWPISLSLTIDDRGFQRYMREIIKRGGDLKPPLKQSGIVMIRSFADNFEGEGRPTKWKPLAPGTIEQRRKNSSRIIQDTGRLRMSTLSNLSEGNIYNLKRYELQMGTNLQVGEWQQFGVKPHVITPKTAPQLAIPIPGNTIFTMKANHPGIDPRPFVLIQEKDEKEITGIFADYLVGE